MGIRFTYFIICISVCCEKKFATIKGSYGERKVNKILSKLDPTVYEIYHDLYVPTEKNKTTQVDHVVASPYGIFVIETKHFDGWIFVGCLAQPEKCRMKNRVRATVPITRTTWTVALTPYFAFPVPAIFIVSCIYCADLCNSFISSSSNSISSCCSTPFLPMIHGMLNATSPS